MHGSSLQDQGEWTDELFTHFEATIDRSEHFKAQVPYVLRDIYAIVFSVGKSQSIVYSLICPIGVCVHLPCEDE